MIASSISVHQPLLYGGISPQDSAVHENTDAEDLDNSSKNPLESASKEVSSAELNKAEQAKVQQLKNRDIEVKAHEQAHLSAAGALASGGASFSYTTGPNGIRYATGGEVHIDTSTIDGNPAATLLKADAIRRAALAPANPSAQDQLVASNATAMADAARTELIQQTQEEPKAKATSEETNTDNEEKEEDNNNIDTSSDKKKSSPPINTTGTVIDFSV